MPTDTPPAPPWSVDTWLNSAEPLSLDRLRGRVVLLHAFQMLCPACVSHGLPQAARAFAMFDPAELCVVGLHTVFEHHAVMGADALRAFVHEYRLGFPIGIDRAGPGRLPLTMAAYALQGTPSLVLIDRHGRLRASHFGHVDDMALGAALARLIAESDADAP